MIEMKKLFFFVFTGFIFVIQYDAHKVINRLLVTQLDNRFLLYGYEDDQKKIRNLKSLNDIKEVELKKARSELNSLKKTIEDLKKQQ